ncbi:hypothetical protein C8Q76DRAFT_747119 [Earliella scabrosa]|nr:hypothetical protein C8Q76DRAFT_747119 [Earliella scabrosa]
MVGVGSPDKPRLAFPFIALRRCPTHYYHNHGQGASPQDVCLLLLALRGEAEVHQYHWKWSWSARRFSTELDALQEDYVDLRSSLGSKSMTAPLITDVLRTLRGSGLKDKAIGEHKLALEKTWGLGSTIDIVLTLISVGFFCGPTT